MEIQSQPISATSDFRVSANTGPVSPTKGRTTTAKTDTSNGSMLRKMKRIYKAVSTKGKEKKGIVHIKQDVSYPVQEVCENTVVTDILTVESSLHSSGYKPTGGCVKHPLLSASESIISDLSLNEYDDESVEMRQECDFDKLDLSTEVRISEGDNESCIEVIAVDVDTLDKPGFTLQLNRCVAFDEGSNSSGLSRECHKEDALQFHELLGNLSSDDESSAHSLPRNIDTKKLEISCDRGMWQVMPTGC